MSHNGKHQTYQRAPCESETGVGHHGAKDTLTATDGVPRDNAAPLDDNRTTGILGARGSTERNLVLCSHANHNHSHHRAAAQAQTPRHPSTLTTVCATLCKYLDISSYLDKAACWTSIQIRGHPYRWNHHAASGGKSTVINLLNVHACF